MGGSGESGGKGRRPVREQPVRPGVQRPAESFRKAHFMSGSVAHFRVRPTSGVHMSVTATAAVRETTTSPTGSESQV